MVGIGLVAALLVGAMAAGSASAKYNVNTYGQFKYCPYEDPQTELCYAGITSGGKAGGFFKLGNVTVKLSKPVTLQGGMYNTEEGFRVLPATNGGLTLESPELKVQGGISVLTREIQEITSWPAALRQSWKEAKKNKEAGVTAVIELAGGNLLYETPEAVSPINTLVEEGPAFKLPLKVRMISPWLEKLGGGLCTIGNDAFPVKQNLTTEGAGRSGHLLSNADESAIDLTGATLVDTNWSVDDGGKASGCGGEYSSYIDNALNYALNIGKSNPPKTGITELTGNLFIAFPSKVKEHAEKGEF